jgi:hypothetical protein
VEEETEGIDSGGRGLGLILLEEFGHARELQSRCRNPLLGEDDPGQQGAELGFHRCGGEADHGAAEQPRLQTRLGGVAQDAGGVGRV